MEYLLFSRKEIVDQYLLTSLGSIAINWEDEEALLEHLKGLGIE